MSRIVKGFPVGRDGRVHGEFTHNPSSLRLSMHRPNLQNIPRGRGDEVERWVKEIFVAPAGNLFWELDFSAIEAVLVGYFAGDPTYIRFAKLGVHAYLASHILKRPADLSWSEADLRDYFRSLKKDHGDVYDTAKRIVHGSNYRMTAGKMHFEYPETFRTVKEAKALQDLYYELFPAINKWHWKLCEEVDGSRRRRPEDGEVVSDPWTLGIGYAQNPFGYRHEFYHVLDWEFKEDDRDGKKYWVKSLGDDAKRLISYLPQSTAAGILKRAAKRVWYEKREVGESLRLLIHDSIIGECAEELADSQVAAVRAIMESPIQQLPLDPAWGMGEFLTIGTESKVGKTWAEMH